MTKTYILPTLIKADTTTPNGNLYSAKLLRDMVDGANNRIKNGAMIPLRYPIDSNNLSGVKGIVYNLLIDDEGTLYAEVDIIDERLQQLIDAMKDDVVLNTQVICNHYNEKDGVRTPKDAELVATCLIIKKDAYNG